MQAEEDVQKITATKKMKFVQERKSKQLKAQPKPVVVLSKSLRYLYITCKSPIETQSCFSIIT